MTGAEAAGMQAVDWAMMVLVCGGVWGGFVALLVRALRSEAKKRGG